MLPGIKAPCFLDNRGSATSDSTAVYLFKLLSSSSLYEQGDNEGNEDEDDGNSNGYADDASNADEAQVGAVPAVVEAIAVEVVGDTEPVVAVVFTGVTGTFGNSNSVVSQ